MYKKVNICIGTHLSYTSHSDVLCSILGINILQCDFKEWHFLSLSNALYIYRWIVLMYAMQRKYRIAPNIEIFEQDQVKRNLFDIQMALAMQWKNWSFIYTYSWYWWWYSHWIRFCNFQHYLTVASNIYAYTLYIISNANSVCVYSMHNLHYICTLKIWNVGYMLFL